MAGGLKPGSGGSLAVLTAYGQFSELWADLNHRACADVSARRDRTGENCVLGNLINRHDAMRLYRKLRQGICSRSQTSCGPRSRNGS